MPVNMCQETELQETFRQALFRLWKENKSHRPIQNAIAKIALGAMKVNILSGASCSGKAHRPASVEADTGASFINAPSSGGSNVSEQASDNEDISFLQSIPSKFWNLADVTNVLHWMIYHGIITEEQKAKITHRNNTEYQKKEYIRDYVIAAAELNTSVLPTLIKILKSINNVYFSPMIKQLSQAPSLKQSNKSLTRQLEP